MLPGVGIFGSEPVAKILVEILKHFNFEIHGIWTNHYEIDSGKYILSDSNNDQSNITTNIDNVLLNKNINLVFVCCQPNFHSQISSKALGIGKNVICISPTCKNIDEILNMINSARYYPSLISSVLYGGLKYLPEFQILKDNLSLLGDIKFCNIIINCQNLTVVRHENAFHDFNSNSTKITSEQATNWLSDIDLGAGVLNRFGASMISFILNLFDDKKVTRVFGTLRTFVDDLENSIKISSVKTKSIRKITADDHCSFQICLEPSSIIVNVVINSLAQCKYSQEIIVSGNDAALVWKNSNLTLRSSTNNDRTEINSLVEQKNTNLKSNDFEFIEKNLNQNKDESANTEAASLLTTKFLNQYKNFELKHPEMPFIYTRGLYSYISKLKNGFEKTHNNDSNNNITAKNLNESPDSLLNLAKNKNDFVSFENFEHTKIVQMIIKDINASSDMKRWITVNY